jgi:hypothetical protein
MLWRVLLPCWRRLAGSGQSTLSTRSRQDILALARDRLAGIQDPAVIIAACKLAVATGDSALRQRVQQLGKERRELQAMGVSDAKLADMVSRMAQDALAGK